MDNTQFNNTISPLDNRYLKLAKSACTYFNEASFYQYRVYVELKYLIFIVRNTSLIKDLSGDNEEQLIKTAKSFSPEDFHKILEFEKQTRHDIKAIEYFLREKLALMGLSSYSSLIHLGITSEDINNLAYGLMLGDFIDKEYLPKLKTLIEKISFKSTQYQNFAMVGRTHGQKAVPTTLGKELAVFVYRLHKLYAKIKKIKLEGKLSGAVGNYNALKFLDSQKNWIKISEEFVKSLGMEFTPLTTQILPLDSYLELFNLTKLVNSVLAGFCQDIWNYASYEYLIIASTEKQVGSSTMPHKVNPIDFENAEGNLGIANSLLSFFADKLPISRLQRDLSDSTVKRNFGVAFGHTMLAFESLLLGLEKISADKQKMLDDLNSDWSILSEAIQTQLRAGMFARGFEKVMAETQGRKMSRKDFLLMVRKLNIDKKILNKLESLSPEEYTGEAINLVELIKV